VTLELPPSHGTLYPRMAHITGVGTISFAELHAAKYIYNFHHFHAKASSLKSVTSAITKIAIKIKNRLVEIKVKLKLIKTRC